MSLKIRSSCPSLGASTVTPLGLFTIKNSSVKLISSVPISTSPLEIVQYDDPDGDGECRAGPGESGGVTQAMATGSGERSHTDRYELQFRQFPALEAEHEGVFAQKRVRVLSSINRRTPYSRRRNDPAPLLRLLEVFRRADSRR